MIDNDTATIPPPAALDLPSPEADVFVMPCSIAQRRFWLLDQLYPGNPALSIPLAVQINGPLDVGVLKRALNAIVARHEILRTTFAMVEGEPKQIIKPEVPLELGIIDLQDVPAEKRQQRLDEEMVVEAARPLSLSRAPIFRTVLLRFAPNDNVLMLTLHHIVGDGWSNGIVVREVGVFYHALLQDKPVDLPPLTVQYADYALWQEEWLKTPQFQTQLDYWKDVLRGAPPVLDMPTDFPRQMNQTYTAYIESLLLPVPLGEALKRLCVDLDITLFMVLFATYVTLLHRYTGQTEFVIGTTAANRNRSELEHLIGLFANPLILHPEASGEMTFRQLATDLRNRLLDGFAHQEVPFEIVLEELQTRKMGARKMTIQAHFLYQKAFMEPATYGDIEIRPLRSVSPGSTFEMAYGVVERPEGIRLQMEYHTALYKNSTIRRMLRHFRRLLEAVVENPDTPVNELALLTDEERTVLEASLVPPVPALEGTAPQVNAQAILQNLQAQLSRHFRESDDPGVALVEPPPGAILIALDSHLRLLPAGVPGELFLGGAPSETLPGKILVTGPADVAKPMPLLRAGFMAQNREDGKVELLGRDIDFAKINGFGVNLRRIEALLQRHPGVNEAASAVFPQASGVNQLVCYFVPKPGANPSEKELRALLQGKISDYTQPAHIQAISELPKDSRGEVVPELLPEPAPPAPSSRDEKIPLEAILYHQLMEIWTDILKVPSVTIEDNFFALGGTSFLALRMMNEVEKLCGRPLPLSLLLTGATVANLAHYISGVNKGSTPALIPVQAKGRRQPIFFLHGDWSGGGFYCDRLSRQLGDDQPFYALPPYRGGAQRVMSLEEMAAFHIAAIKERSPQGPYLLGGYCIGATVAMEIARQLVAKGEKVTHLLLIDPPQWIAVWLRGYWPLVDIAGNALGWDLSKKIYFFDRTGVSFARWTKRPWRNKVAALSRRLGLDRPHGAAPIAAEEEAGEDGEILKSLDYAVYFLGYRLYSLRPLAAPATLYFPEETMTSQGCWLKRLSRSTAAITVESVPGNHHTCVTKYVSGLAEKVQKTLEHL
jgi:Condensation domain/Thioesterase domain/Phosphopantetheine attachment site/AMP-binding enzyme C-terminal domain